MSPEPEAGLDEKSQPVCRKCKSRHVRRSSPHTMWERIVRKFAGIRFHVCGDCGARGWHHEKRHSRSHPSASQRLVSGRFTQASRARRRQVLRTAAVALALGMAAAVWLHRCEGRPGASSTREAG
jgi:hypothetical protein